MAEEPCIPEDARNKIATFVDRLTQLNAAINEKNRVNEGFKGDVLNRIKELRKTIATLTGKLAGITAQISSLTEQNRIVVEEKNALEARVNELQAQVAELTRLREEAGREIERLNAEIARITGEKDAEIARITGEKDAEIARITGEKDAAIAAEVAKNADKDAAIERLTEEKRVEVERITGELTAAQEALRKCNEDAARCRAEIDAIVAQITAIDGQITVNTENAANLSRDADATSGALAEELRQLEEEVNAVAGGIPGGLPIPPPGGVVLRPAFPPPPPPGPGGVPGGPVVPPAPPVVINDRSELSVPADTGSIKRITLGDFKDLLRSKITALGGRRAPASKKYIDTLALISRPDLTVEIFNAALAANGVQINEREELLGGKTRRRKAVRGKKTRKVRKGRKGRKTKKSQRGGFIANFYKKNKNTKKTSTRRASTSN
jgi:uncharacterized protein YoxC